ncbi:MULTISPECIES: ABC transporter permease [Corynebacterium]|uniref:ABC-2 family transporter protein n=1 Tax=Corynebacterium ihumii TaxID=1232427 RepID=A0ABY7UD70_9CORY|nr:MULTISPECIES: ABC transporter permease [Corynebacterium]WCZ34615.1 ABC-2 family transporter protein [Corynebacterium ihumii]
MKKLTPGIFAPAPQRASFGQMAAAQGRIEAKLMLRHGEQLLLNVLIPAAILVAAHFAPILGDNTEFDVLVPMVFAVAATGAGFTGQAIAVAFDRRYGALKRTGASGVPPWTIIVGKILGVLATVVVQLVVLGAIALALGWRVCPAGAVFGLATLLVGVAAFTAMGLLMGGTLRAELVLALANLIWLVLMGILGWVGYSGDIAHAGWWNAVPTVALAGALVQALSLQVNWVAWASLAAWGVAAMTAAVRLFRFDG